MDVSKIEISSGESLPIKDNVYRHVLSNVRDKKERDKFVPHVKGFSLSDADKADGYSLSVDWDKMTTPEQAVARIGCAYKHSSEVFKDYTNRDIYSLSIDFLKSINGVENVIYNPIQNKLRQKGYPDNISHSLVLFIEEIYKKNEPYIILQIRNHAKDRKVSFDMDQVKSIVEEYRSS